MKSMQYQRGDFSPNSRILFLSLTATIVGLLATIFAKVLLDLINLFTNVFYFGTLSFEHRSPSMEYWGIAFIFVPVIGALIIGLMARFGSEKIRGHGIPEALETILFGKSIMQPRIAVLKPISSAISIGSGGPFGAEGPIIMTGGAAGSLLAQFLNLTSAERKVLLVAGAAAGMSAVFATPIAAVLLSVELLLFEWRPRSIIPVAVASSCAALMRVPLLGSGPTFPVPSFSAFTDTAILSAVIIGISTGALATFLSNMLYKLEDQFQKLPIHWMWWPMLGAFAVGVGGYFQPRALGVGYDVITDLLAGHISTSQILPLLAVKVFIWIIALASGTSGGVLAPLLIFGGALGSLEGLFLPGEVPAGLWALIGMGAIMAGMMRSPLTAIIFCVELTLNTEVLLPLLVACTCSYAFTVLTMKRSILTEKVARRGYDIYREYCVDPLERFTVRDVFTPDEVTKVDEHVKASSNLKIYLEDSCRLAAERMAEHDVAQLMVVSRHDGSELGILSLKALLKARQFHCVEESYRETLFPFKRSR